MATGRAVVVCDGRGLAGFVTQQRARQWRPRNFGLRTLTRAVDDKALIEEIDAYDPKESADVCGFIREHANQENWLDDIEALHREAVAHHATSTASSAAMATARHVERWSPRADGSLPLVMRTTGIAAAAVPIGSGSVRPKLGMKCPWNEAVEESNAVLLGGFSAPEPWGTWLTADAAGAMLRLPKMQDGRDLALSFEIIPFTPRADLPLCVEVKVNGLYAATWSFSITEHGHKVSRLVRCPASQLHDRDHVWLSFDVRHACSPTDCGLGLDSRHLSIGLVGFTFR
jgi:hypothetical protein